MKWLSAVMLTLLVALAGPVMACDLVNSGLPDDVRKELELKCLQAKKAAEEKATEVATATQVTQLSAYAGIATEVATAIGMAAKQLGVEVNNFIVTPAGIITLFIIVFKVFGKLIAVMFMAAIVNYIVWRLVRKIWYYDSGETIEISVWWGWGKRTVPVMKRTTYSAASEGQVFLTIILGILAFGSLVLIPVFS